MEPAYVLHSRKFGEHHLLLDMITFSGGRRSLMARGAASSRSTRRALLQPFVPLLVSWNGRGSISNLKQVESRKGNISLQGKALFSGFYLNEILIRLLSENEPMPELFISYERALQALAESQDLDRILRGFELELLQTLGYGVDLLHEGQSEAPVTSNEGYQYEPESGLRRVIGDETCLVQGDTLLALANNDSMDERQTREARQLMRLVLGYYLGDKPLRSREFFTRYSNRK